MKPNTQFCLGSMPRLFISHEDLERIKYVVDLAPKEAQWFCRVEKAKAGSTTYYRVYEMYIPEQICSSAEVESEPMMMVKFFKELREEHGVEKTNEIMKNMTAWCHSHHNMGVSPSGQDIKQFNENIENAKLAKQTSPQMMFIFNKKDQYHLKVWDPETDIVYQNLELELLPYDFSEIKDQTKSKFKAKVYKKSESSKYLHSASSKTEKSWDFLEWGMEEDDSFSKSLSKPITSLYIEVGIQDHPSAVALLKPYTESKYTKFINNLIKDFDELELSIFCTTLDLDMAEIWKLQKEIAPITVEEAHQKLEESIEAYDYDEDLMSCILIFTMHLRSFQSKSKEIIEEFSHVFDEWEDYDPTDLLMEF